MYGKDVAMVICSSEEIMITMDMDLALKTFSECLIENGFDLEDQASIDDNKDFYISIAQMDVRSGLIEHFETPESFKNRYNLKSPILFTGIADKEEDAIVIEESDYDELLCAGVGGEYKNFRVMYDDIPDVTDRDSYVDGDTERRILVFVDVDTNLEHHINYSYSEEYGSDFCGSDTVKIVEDKKSAVVEKTDPPLLSPQESKRNMLVIEYKSADESTRISPTKKILKDPEIVDILNLIKTEKFSICDIQIPIYQYAIDHNMNAEEVFKLIQKHS